MGRRLFAGAAVLLALAASGCGGAPRLTTKGRLVKDGQPFAPGEGEIVGVIFVPLPADGGGPRNYYAAMYNPEEGPFQASGPDRKGVPPGRYRVTVEVLKNKKDLLHGAFNDDEKSPFM